MQDYNEYDYNFDSGLMPTSHILTAISDSPSGIMQMDRANRVLRVAKAVIKHGVKPVALYMRLKHSTLLLRKD